MVDLQTLQAVADGVADAVGYVFYVGPDRWARGVIRTTFIVLSAPALIRFAPTRARNVLAAGVILLLTRHKDEYAEALPKGSPLRTFTTSRSHLPYRLRDVPRFAMRRASV